MAKIITFGEIMARMAPSGVLRLRQVLPGSLDVTFAGAEANVAASLAQLGTDVEFVTALPDNSPLTDGCLADLRSLGIGTRHIQISDRGRFGIYFVEMGANQRPSRVYYDRDSSSISLSKPGDFNWREILKDAAWLHLTGITPALSASAAAVTLEAAEAARSMGVRVAFDVNFRSKLWRWDSARTPQKLAGETLQQLIPLVNLLMANEEDGKLLGVTLPPAEAGLGGSQFHIDRAIGFAKAMTNRYPQIELFSTTFREQLSASHNNWGAMLFDAKTGATNLAPLKDGEYRPYEIRNIVDRVGSGDAFDAGLLFGLTHPEFDHQRTLEFATSAACLAHSIVGDCNFATQQEIEELTQGSGSGRVVR